MRQHVCGIMGFNPMIDGRCPGCVDNEIQHQVGDFISERWENGVSHNKKTDQLIYLIRAVDKTDALQLEYGGDGDNGETLAFIIDELIDRGYIRLEIV